MANEAQVQEILEVMKQQMAQMALLHTDNTRLREAADAASRTPAPATLAVATNSSEDTVANTYRSKRPDRPVINASLDDREWALFEDTWVRYKTMINVTDLAAIRMELRAACSEDVNRLLFEFVGSEILDACTEKDLLAHIKSVAVKSVHKEVHRMAFNTMCQEPGQSITNFVAKLKAKAFLCQFNVVCTGHAPQLHISFSEEMVSQRLIAGLRNQEHQRRILAEAPDLPTLAEKIARLQVLETTEESVSLLHNKPPPPPSQASAARSAYKKKKNKNAREESTPSPKCRYCGRTSHPGGQSVSDRATCPARDKECHKCHSMGHLAPVCEKNNSSANAATRNDGDVAEEEMLDAIPSEASFSFAFGASAQEPPVQESAQDFRRGRQRNIII